MSKKYWYENNQNETMQKVLKWKTGVMEYWKKEDWNNGI